MEGAGGGSGATGGQRGQGIRELSHSLTVQKDKTDSNQTDKLMDHPRWHLFIWATSWSTEKHRLGGRQEEAGGHLATTLTMPAELSHLP